MVDDNPYAPPNASIQHTEKVPATSIKTWPSICRWIAGFVLIAFLIGVMHGRLTQSHITELIPDRDVYALSALGTMLGICVAFVVRFWRYPVRDAIVAVEIGFFCVWLAEYVGWSIVYGDINDDVLCVTLIRWVCSAILGASVIMIPHTRHIGNPSASPV